MQPLVSDPTATLPPRFVDEQDLLTLPPRPADSHKGTFGRVTVIGGAPGMCGAPYFAAKTAYRAGAGLVELCSAPENRIPLQVLLPEAVLTICDPATETGASALPALLSRADSVVLGCGMGQSEAAALLCERVIRQALVPLVLDADALNLLATHPTWHAALRARTAPTILTPHLGEASRLCGRPISDIARSLPATAAALAKSYGAVCVLKAANTHISDGTTCYHQSHGNSGMATGGSGDCLAGLLGSLLAQYRHANLPSAYLSALGVLIHAMAGDLAAARLGEHALMASDLADAVGEVLHHTSRPESTP